MSGNSLVLDTSVIIDILGGDRRAAALVQDAIVYVSVITRVELLSVTKPRTHPAEAALAFLAGCKLVQFSDEIQDLILGELTIKPPYCKYHVTGSAFV